ncbi:MAG: amidohydrolase family protein, partial [Chloroflexi bacterium]|nr:amidohydrolase family protein [Chloroflexota bacterium]
MKRTHWHVLAMVVAGFVLLAACSDDEPSQQSSPDVAADSVADRDSGDSPSDAARTDTPADTGTTTEPPADRGQAQPRADCLADSTTIALINGVILTVDATDSQASSLLIEDSRITAVGDSITVPEGACIVDLAGHTVVPGFIDSHVHFSRDWVWPGYFLWQIEEARSTQDVLDGLRARIETVPAGEYITVIGGYPTNAFALPTLAELDAAAPDHPVYLQASFSGPATVNSLAKAHLEANGHSSIAANGSIPLDRQTRTPRAVQILQGEQTEADAERAAKEYMTWANSMGITTVIDMSSTGDADRAYQLWESDQLTLRMRLRFGGLGTIETTIRAVEAALARVGDGDDMLRVIGVGEFSLGGFGDTTADFAAGWSEIAALGWPLAQHSLRPAENDAHLSAFEEVNASTPLADLHWSLDHASQVSPDQLSRLAQLGVGVGVHNFAYYGSFGGGAPFRDIIDAGVTAGAGSDGRAIGPLDPWQGIHYMVTGRTIAGSLVNDGQQITRLEALRLYTMGSAWTALEEDQLGSIEVGKFADLVILNADFLTLPEDEIDDIAAAMTFVGGVLVYDDGTLSAANDDNASSASIAGEAAAFTLLEWNITGGQVARNRSIVQDIFATEDADIIVLQETGRGAATIAEILGDDYTLVVATRGQDIWVKDNGRFNVTATDLFDGGCDDFDLATASVTLEDTRSDGRLLHLYSSHFCIPTAAF